jgi:hypothetical protein
MTVTRQSTAREIGTVFAARVREESIARELWVTSERDGVHLWLLIDPIEDDDAERELYGLLDVLDEPFPDADFQLHVLNPLTYTSDPRESLPLYAERIPLRAA